MKEIKKIAAVCALVGMLLALGTVVLSLTQLHTNPVLFATSEDAAYTAQELMDALEKGNFSKAQTILYGTPSLGVDREPADEVGKLIWEAFRKSITYEFQGDMYATSGGLARDVSITTLDLASVTQPLKSRSEALLEKRIQSAEDMSQVYDENNEYREEFVMQVLYDAASEILKKDAGYVTREITLNIVYRQEQWWIMPDQALVQAISGGTAG